MLLLNRPSYRSILNHVIHLVLILMKEWRNSNYHLIDENPKSPPVQGVVVPRTHNHLRRQVLWRPTERVRFSALFCTDYFCQAKVCQLDVAIRIYKNIFRFKIPINYACLMQVTKRNSNLGRIELSLSL